VNDAGQAEMRRYEPTNGITDRSLISGDSSWLHQSDEEFYSIVVSMGTMGVVYAYTVEVVDMYFVNETKEAFVWPDDWDDALRRAKSGEDISISLHPYSTKDGGKHRGIITKFQRMTKEEVLAHDPTLWYNPPPPQEMMDLPVLAQIMEALGGADWAAGMSTSVFSIAAVRSALDEYFDDAPNDPPFISIYNNTYLRPTGDTYRATFAESAVPIDDLKAYTKRVLEEVEKHKLNDLVIIPSSDKFEFFVPFSLRFVGASKHYLSMHHGRDSGTLERFMMRNLHNRDYALRTIFEEVDLRERWRFNHPRSHWGMMFWAPEPFPDAMNLLLEPYPKAALWLKMYHELNQKGVFNGPMTNELHLPDPIDRPMCPTSYDCRKPSANGNGKGDSCGRQPNPRWCNSGNCCDMDQPQSVFLLGKGGGTCVDPQCWYTTPIHENTDAAW